MSDNALIPDRYPQHDLFICDVADATVKEMSAVMEHPFYSLSKKPETTVRRYEQKGDWLEIVPSVKGLATIYDKDILIYCISQIIAKKNLGEPISKRVRINTRELLQFTNRGTAGKDYKALCEALDRLDGTRIRTNIKRGDNEQFQAFGLINAASVARKHGLDGRLLYCEIELSDWVFQAIENSNVLTLHRDYFRLRKPIERRVYELARKHCGRQDQWRCSLATLHKKSGSKSTLREFRRAIKHLSEHDHLPDYSVTLAEGDFIDFTNRQTIPPLEDPSPILNIGALRTETYEKAREVAPSWDIYYLEREWRAWAKTQPKNPDAAFIGFCKSWYKRKGKA